MLKSSFFSLHSLILAHLTSYTTFPLKYSYPAQLKRNKELESVLLFFAPNTQKKNIALVPSGFKA